MRYTQILVMLALVSCTKEGTITKLEPNPFFRESRLDQVVRTDLSMRNVLMLDSIPITGGSIGLFISDTTRFHFGIGREVYPIGLIDPNSPDSKKWASFNKVQRMFSIRALDSNGQSGKESWDTAIWVVFADYYQTSMAFDSEEEASDYNFQWNGQNPAHRRTLDSFQKVYFPKNRILQTDVFSRTFDRININELWSLFDNVNLFIRDPKNESYGYDWHLLTPGVEFLFEAGKPDYLTGALPRNSIDDGYFYVPFLVSPYRKVYPESSITDVQLSDGRIHRVLYMKLPYVFPEYLQYPSGYVRVKYILD